MKVSGRVEGTISELRAQYGLENLDLAYNHAGTYQGFGWKKGTLEMLEQRKRGGERVEIVYENGIFQGYGYVTRKLEAADHQNPYVTGASLHFTMRSGSIRPGIHRIMHLKVLRSQGTEMEM